MVRQHMIGKKMGKEELEERIEINEANRTPDKLKTVKIVPTMQTGYNSDGTIKEERIEPQIYELNGKKDK
ncbi:hypothetical protein [Clostridium sp. DJ247]|uniref:hypothetical protein n=1 Tax=Clostridium sp. DJ247 TaxID=2726188 RepID=UPI0016278B86|nr:hypothetical protein [Clostridium sp. DJ247]MBC2581128.1 hypothetical protein [Clostridium sp. DJ247]